MIKAVDLYYVYDHGSSRAKEALSSLSFHVDGGKCLGIVGGPGAGKSTLGYNVAGLLYPTGGRLIIADVEADGRRASQRVITSRVGLVPQWPERQLFARTVAEDVAAGLGRGKRRPQGWEVRVREALRTVGLDAPGIWEREVFSLSGGEARKVAVAGIIILGRPIIVFDEPAAGLDERSRSEILALMKKIKAEGRTLVIISHRLSDILPLADTLLALESGRCLFFGELKEALLQEELISRGVLQRPPLTDLFLRLRKKGANLKKECSDPAEACEEIYRCLRGSQGRG